MRRSKLPGKEELRRLYWDEMKSPKEIAAMFDVAEDTVLSKMRRLGIERRTKSEGARLSHQGGQRKPLKATQLPLRDVLTCPACFWVWRREAVQVKHVCPQCGHTVDARMRRNSIIKPDADRIRLWRANNPSQTKGQHQRRYRKMRKSVLLLVGKGEVRCVRCGCDKPEILEINHKHGGGAKEVKGQARALAFYRDIVQLRRSTDDLELCCKVCNALHYLEMKYGSLPYRIVWKGGDAKWGEM